MLARAQSGGKSIFSFWNHRSKIKHILQTEIIYTKTMIYIFSSHLTNCSQCLGFLRIIIRDHLVLCDHLGVLQMILFDDNFIAIEFLFLDQKI